MAAVVERAAEARNLSRREFLCLPALNLLKISSIQLFCRRMQPL